MSAVNAPYGFDPIRHPSGLVRSNAYIGGIVSGYASNIFKGQPVLLAAGKLQPVTANNVDFLGVFAGVEYTDSATLKPIVSPYWPAGSSYVAGTLVAYVWDDPMIVFRAQADGSVADGSVGKQFNISNFAASASLPVGLSQATLAAAPVAASAQGQWRCTALYDDPANAWGDAFTQLEVQIARSQYVAAKTAPF